MRAAASSISARVWTPAQLVKLNVARPFVCQNAATYVFRSYVTVPSSKKKPEAAGRPTLQQRRKETTLSGPKSSPPKTAKYDFAQIKEKITESKSSKHILIDVREPSEYAGGFIPTAINIPIKSQPDALALTQEEFEDRFGFAKPDNKKEVIFYCKSGVRSAAAAQLAQQFGYETVSEYPGSWGDWFAKGGKVSRP